MKSDSYKATYSSWLETHDASHKEYQRRKRYPWHIIGKIIFSTALIGSTQQIYNKTDVLLGEAVINKVKNRPEEDRIQFDFQIRTKSYTDDFCVVFLNSGLLITIFDLGKDIEKDSIKKYLKGDNIELYSKKLTKLILLEFVWRKLKGLGIYKKQRSFDRIIIENTLSNIRPKDNFIVDISDERNLWIFISLFEYEANPIELRYSNQCESIISLFLVQSNYIPDQSPNEQNIYPINRYLSESLTKKEVEVLEGLKKDVLKFAKFI